MRLSCSAIIKDDYERQRVRETVVKQLANSYSDVRDTKKLTATYIGNNLEIAKLLIATFEKYPEHSIFQDNQRKER